jgi:ribosomal protein L30E
MSNGQEKTINEYRTPDMYLATFLYCLGHEMKIERLSESKVIFLFSSNPEKVEKDANGYFNKATIPAVTYGAELKTMKSRIYSKQKK